LAFVVFASGLRSLIAKAEPEPAPLAALAWAGGLACSVLVLAGNAVSRATAFAAMSLRRTLGRPRYHAAVRIRQAKEEQACSACALETQHFPTGKQAVGSSLSA
jgi:hypothetical protein